MLKTVLSLHDKVIPPSLHCEQRNPDIDFANSPFYVCDDLRDWEKPACGVRRGAVSAFGFGGTNFHVVLEEHIPGRLNGGSRKYHSIPFTRETDQSPPAVAASHFAAQLAAKPPHRGIALLGADNAAKLAGRLRTLKAEAEASKVLTGQAPLARDIGAPQRIAIDFGDPLELSKKIDIAAKALERNDSGFWRALGAQGIFHGRGDRQKVAFLFPGQGSQYINMLMELRESEALVRETLDQADRVMEPILGKALSEYIYVDGQDTDKLKKANRALMQTEITQPALIACDIALARLLHAYGMTPDMVMGHSLGEYGALVQARALNFADALEAVAARGREMTRVSMGDNGKMAAVFAPLTDVQRLLTKIEGYAVIANINSYQQSVIGGESAAIEQAVEMFTAEGVQAVPLPVSHAFHTRIVAPASQPLRKVLSRMHLRAPAIPTICNVTGGFYPKGCRRPRTRRRPPPARPAPTSRRSSRSGRRSRRSAAPTWPAAVEPAGQRALQQPRDLGRAGEQHAHARARRRPAPRRRSRRGRAAAAAHARGTPAACSARTAAAATSGVCSAGLASTVLPAASAAATWPVKIASGKFHGLMQTTGPSGSCVALSKSRRTSAA